MKRTKINLLAAAVIVAGAGVLSRPAHATVSPAPGPLDQCCAGGKFYCCGPNYCSVGSWGCNSG